jgi:DNA-binding FadR family transcriptional regulator
MAERAQAVCGDVILSGAELPSLRQVMAELKVGRPKAREARAHLATLAPMNGHAPAG